MTIARSVSTVTAGVASAVTRGQGAGGSAALDIRASVGTSTSPTSTGTKDIALPFEAKAFLPFGSLVSSNGVTSDNACLGFGAGLSSSNRAAIGVSSRSSVTTSATARHHNNGKVHYPLYNEVNFYAIADIQSVASDKVTLNWTAASAAWILNHIALGGADLEVSLTQQQMNGTNAAQSFAHGLSGAPTGVMFFGLPLSIAPATTQNDLLLNIGAWASTGQFCASISSATGVTTTATRRRLSTTEVMTDLYSAVTRSMAVSTVDATNVNVTYPVTTSTNQLRFFMLAFRGARAQVGTFDCNGSTSPLTINTTGITPKLFLPVFVQNGVRGGLGTIFGDIRFAIGASDGTNNVSCGITDQDGQTTTNARRWQSSTTLVERTANGNLNFEGTAAFSGESVVLTPTTITNNTWGNGGYLVIGS